LEGEVISARSIKVTTPEKKGHKAKETQGSRRLQNFPGESKEYLKCSTAEYKKRLERKGEKSQGAMKGQKRNLIKADEGTKTDGG